MLYHWSQSYLLYITPLILITILSYVLQRRGMSRKIWLIIPAFLISILLGLGISFQIFSGMPDGGGFGILFLAPIITSVFTGNLSVTAYDVAGNSTNIVRCLRLLNPDRGEVDRQRCEIC